MSISVVVSMLSARARCDVMPQAVVFVVIEHMIGFERTRQLHGKITSAMVKNLSAVIVAFISGTIYIYCYSKLRLIRSIKFYTDTLAVLQKSTHTTS